MESLLRFDPESPSFATRVAEYASEGNLEEMVDMGIWKRSNPQFICSTPYMLVVNTWHEPLQLLCDQNLLHALAGCA